MILGYERAKKLVTAAPVRGATTTKHRGIRDVPNLCKCNIKQGVWVHRRRGWLKMQR